MFWWQMAFCHSWMTLLLLSSTPLTFIESSVSWFSCTFPSKRCNDVNNLTWTTFSTECLPESTFPFLCLYSFMFLNSALCFHGLVPAETFHEAELIICVCAEAVSIKKHAEINTRTFWVIENWQGGCRTRLKSNLQNTPTVRGCPWIKHLICYKPSRSHPSCMVESN